MQVILCIPNLLRNDERLMVFDATWPAGVQIFGKFRVASQFASVVGHQHRRSRKRGDPLGRRHAAGRQACRSAHVLHVMLNPVFKHIRDLLVVYSAAIV
jgi:hypothetical protein